MVEKQKYTQRDWDRTVGYGKVPPEYMYDGEIIEALEGGCVGLLDQLDEEHRKKIREAFDMTKYLSKYNDGVEEDDDMTVGEAIEMLKEYSCKMNDAQLLCVEKMVDKAKKNEK